VGGLCGIVGLVVVAFALAFGPFVRARIAKEGARRGLAITVGRVRPGLFAIRLNDVRIKLEGVADVDVSLFNVRVELSATLSPKEVSAEGGEIHVNGEPNEVVDKLRRFRKVGGGREPTERRPMPIRASGVSLAWQMPKEGTIAAAGLRFARTNDALDFGCTELTVAYQRTTVRVTNADVEFPSNGNARVVKATALAIEQKAESIPSALAPSAMGGIVDPVPPPLPPPAQPAQPARDKTAPQSVKAGSVAEPEAPLLVALPDLHALRIKIAAFATILGEHLADGTKVDVGGVSFKLGVGKEQLSIGPGPLSFERRGDVVRATFMSEVGRDHDEGATQSAPLSFDLEIPIGRGDVVARLEGGAVSLALLGIKNGSRGLSDVEHAEILGKGLVVLAAAGDTLTFDGHVALRSISITEPRLSLEPVKGLDFAVTARGAFDDKGLVRIDDARLDMGALHMQAQGLIEETTDHFGVTLAGNVAPASCQALLKSAPEGLLSTVRAARMTGTFGATARIAFDTRTIDKLTMTYEIDDRCKIASVPPELSRDRFTGSFTYRTYHPDGTPSETTTGPGTPNWTALEDISPFMVAAVLTTEDAAFYKHHGFNHAAIRGSTAANLKARRFVRGASTITMQLAKNLFLSRSKAMSRKIEEVILTAYLEQVFSKDEMMELYLNVVEFGPDIYGITRAAAHYFGRKPNELTLPECFFLATMLPAPVRYGKFWDKGQVSERWMNYIQALMQIAEKNGNVTQDELDVGLTQPIVFHKPGQPMPEPRAPIRR